jgi:hypothetical protein
MRGLFSYLLVATRPTSDVCIPLCAKCYLYLYPSIVSIHGSYIVPVELNAVLHRSRRSNGLLICVPETARAAYGGREAAVSIAYPPLHMRGTVCKDSATALHAVDAPLFSTATDSIYLLLAVVQDSGKDAAYIKILQVAGARRCYEYLMLMALAALFCP